MTAGRSEAWLSRLSGGQEIAGSNPVGPKLTKHKPLSVAAASVFEVAAGGLLLQLHAATAKWPTQRSKTHYRFVLTAFSEVQYAGKPYHGSKMAFVRRGS